MRTYRDSQHGDKSDKHHKGKDHKHKGQHHFFFMIGFGFLFAILGCLIARCCQRRKQCMKKYRKQCELKNVFYYFNLENFS